MSIICFLFLSLEGNIFIQFLLIIIIIFIINKKILFLNYFYNNGINKNRIFIRKFHKKKYIYINRTIQSFSIPTIPSYIFPYDIMTYTPTCSSLFLFYSFFHFIQTNHAFLEHIGSRLPETTIPLSHNS